MEKIGRRKKKKISMRPEESERVSQSGHKQRKGRERVRKTERDCWTKGI